MTITHAGSGAVASRTAGGRRRWIALLAPVVGLAAIAASAAPAAAAPRDKWQFQVVDKAGDLYKPVGTGLFKDDYKDGIWIGTPGTRPANTTQAGPRDRTGLFQLTAAPAHCGNTQEFTSIGAAQGLILHNNTGRPIEKIELEIKAGDTFTGVNAGDDGKIKVTNVGNKLTVEFKPAVQPGQYIWMRFGRFVAADQVGAKGRLICGPAPAPPPRRCAEGSLDPDLDKATTGGLAISAASSTDETGEDAGGDLWFGPDDDSASNVEPICAVVVL